MKITINSDLGEAFGIHSFGNDEGLMEIIDMANVACGFHSGDPNVMAKTVELAIEHGVAIGAHPGLPDLTGFGRRRMELEPAELRNLLRYQVGALVSFIEANGSTLSHIKPHGSLYDMVANDEGLMNSVCDVALQYEVPVLGMAGTLHESVARARGVEFVAEYYVDLPYDDSGVLTSARRMTPPSLEEIGEMTDVALEEGLLTSINGNRLPVKFDSICVHSDSSTAIGVAAVVREHVDRHFGGTCR